MTQRHDADLLRRGKSATPRSSLADKPPPDGACRSKKVHLGCPGRDENARTAKILFLETAAFARRLCEGKEWTPLHLTCGSLSWRLKWLQERQLPQPALWEQEIKGTWHSRQMAAVSPSLLGSPILRAERRESRPVMSAILLASLGAACQVTSGEGCVRRESEQTTGKAYVCRAESAGRLGTFSHRSRPRDLKVPLAAVLTTG